MDGARLERHHVVLDLHAGTGLLTWEAVRRVPEGGVWALAADEATAEGLRQQAARLAELERPHLLAGSLIELDRLLLDQDQPDLRFDALVGRNPMTEVDAGQRARIAGGLAALLAPGGRISLAQVLPRHTQRIYRLVDVEELPAGLAARIIAAEEAIYENPDDPWVNWDADDLAAAFRDAGLGTVEVRVETAQTEVRVTGSLLDRWFHVPDASEPRRRPTYAQHLARPSDAGPSLDAGELLAYRGLLERICLNQSVRWETSTAFVVAAR